MKPVFISYARGVSYDAARRLCEKLGNAFFDTAEIRPGERFPSALVDALLNCRVFVLFASREYFERKYCRLELCAALATYQAAVRESRNAASEVKHIIVALAAGGGPQLQELPPELRRGNWPAADDLDGLATLIEARLSEVPESLARRLASIDVLSVREMLAEEASMPEPKPLHGIPRHLPDLIDSIGPFYGRVDELHRLHRACPARRRFAGRF